MDEARTKVIVENHDGATLKLFVRSNITVAQFMLRMRQKHPIRCYQALILLCQDEDGQMHFPPASALLSDLPYHDDNSVHLSLKLENTFG